MRLRHLPYYLSLGLMLLFSSLVASADDPAATYVENFDHDGNPPGGWIIDEGITYNGELFSDSKGSTSNFFLNARRAVSPKLAFAQGDKLTFDTHPYSRASTFITVEVCVSTDRTNWESVFKLSYDGGNGIEEWPGGNIAKNYTVDMPEGEYYVGLFLNSAYIDNFKGGTLVPLTGFDAYISSYNIPGNGVINNPYTASVTLSNMAGDIAADAYTAALYAAPIPEGWNGESELTYSKVADVMNEAIPSLNTKALEASYIPHKPGNYMMYISMDFGDDKVFSTAKAQVKIKEESLGGDIPLGTSKGFTTDDITPVCMYYCNSQSQTLYTPEMLAAAGIMPGAKITGMFFRGYGGQSKQIKANVYMGIKATDKTELGPQSYETFENADYQGTQYIDYVNSDGEAGLKNYFDTDFATPFIYEGGNIVVDVKSEADSYAPVYVEYEEILDPTVHRVIAKRHDNLNSFKNTSLGLKYRAPIPYFKVQLDPAVLSGKVTYQEQPVAGAEITIENEGVIYSAVSDEEGNYSMNVVQNERTYALTALSEGHPRYTGIDPVVFTDGNLTYDIALRDWPTLSGTVKNSKGEVVGGMDIKVANGENVYTDKVNADGTYSVTVNNIDVRPYTITVDNPAYPIYTGETDFYNGLSKALDIVLADFTNERAFNLNLAVTDVRGTSLEGTKFSLHNDNFNFDYDAAETALDAEGKAALKLTGGKHILKIELPGMLPVNKEFYVNKDVALEVNLLEDVRTPLDVKAELKHDVFSGKNDIVMTWAANPESDPQPAVQRSAQNPVEVFIITLDGKEVGQTDQYTYTLENVEDGDHKVAVYAKYTAQQSNPVTVKVAISAADYAALNFKLSTNNGVSTEGFIVKVEGNGTNYELTVKDAKAGIGYLPKGEYKVSVEAPYFDRYEKTVDLTEKMALYIDLEETLTALDAVTAKATQVSGKELFTVEVEWTKKSVAEGELDPYANVKSYDVLLDGEKVGNTTDSKFTINNVAPGAHTVGVSAVYASGASEAKTCELSLVSGIDGLDAEAQRGDLFTLTGVLIMRDATSADVKRLEKGIYIFCGKKIVVK